MFVPLWLVGLALAYIGASMVALAITVVGDEVGPPFDLAVAYLGLVFLIPGVAVLLVCLGRAVFGA